MNSDGERVLAGDVLAGSASAIDRGPATLVAAGIERGEHPRRRDGGPPPPAGAAGRPRPGGPGDVVVLDAGLVPRLTLVGGVVAHADHDLPFDVPPDRQRPVWCDVVPGGAAAAGRRRRDRAPSASKSRSATATPSPSGTCASTVPHGSMIMLRPYEAVPSSWVPHWPAASTKTWFSMARARSRTSQWSRPVATVNAAGTTTTSAPSAPRRRYSSGNRRS